jgi:hypothetical protein
MGGPDLMADRILLGRRLFIARRSLLHVAFASGMVVVLLIICYWKGEPPRWRWGK